MAAPSARFKSEVSLPGLLSTVWGFFGKVGDSRRQASVQFSMPDTLMAGLAIFFTLKYPSLLMFDQHARTGESISTHNLQTLFGLDLVPSDTQMRSVLDPVSLEELRGAFKAVHTGLQRSNSLKQFQWLNGKLLLVSNTKDLSPEDIVTRYKSLADIERGFRVLKSELEIGPVFHRLPDRIRAHASICFIALIIHRIIRQCLKQSQCALSPERALESLRRIQRHKITLNEKTHSGISTLSDEQGELLSSLSVAKPNESWQLSLL